MNLKNIIILLSIFCRMNSELNNDLVNELTIIAPDEIENYIKINDYTLILFITQNCIKCKQTEPIVFDLSLKFKSKNIDIDFFKVDLTQNESLKQKLNVQVFPMIYLFAFERPIVYKNEVDFEEIEKWIKLKTENKIKELKEIAQIKSVIKSHSCVLLSSEIPNLQMLKDFKSLAAIYNNLPFYITYVEEVKEWIGSNQKNHFIIFKNIKDEKLVLANDNKIEFETMKGFLVNAGLNYIIELNEETVKEIFESGKPIIIWFTENNDTQISNQLTKTAEDFEKEFIFTHTGTLKGIGSRLAEHFGVAKEENNTIFLIFLTNNRWEKYKLENVIDEFNLRLFLMQFKKGKLERLFKSEILPKNNGSFLKKVVGQNFNEFILENEVDVVLFVEGNHCSFCDDLRMIIEKLAKSLQKEINLGFFRINGSLNEHKKFKFDVFPVLKLFKSGKKNEPIEMQGEKTMKGILETLKLYLGRELDIIEGDELEDLKEL